MVVQTEEAEEQEAGSCYALAVSMPSAPQLLVQGSPELLALPAPHSPEPGAALPAPRNGVEDEAAPQTAAPSGVAGSGAIQPSSAAPVRPAWKERVPRETRAPMHAARGEGEEGSGEEEDESEEQDESEEEDSSSSIDSGSSEPLGCDGEEWVSPVASRVARGRDARQNLLGLNATTSAVGHLLQEQANLGSLADLAAADARFDVDGYSAIFRGDEMLTTLGELIGDATHILDPLGAEWARSRSLYDPAFWAIVGLQCPRLRLGMGIALERNEHGWSTHDVEANKVVTIGGQPVRLTLEMVDEGLEKVTTFLDNPARQSLHHSITGLRHHRLPAGFHGVWAFHAPVQIYKILYAARNCNLGILVFDFGRKAA